MVKVILDTNVLLSGLFFGGIPLKVIETCFDGTARMVVSPEIIEEYKEAGSHLQKTHKLPSFNKTLGLLIQRATIVYTKPLEQQICRDSDDDKFIACLLTSGADCIVSGDNDLLSLPSSSPHRILVLRPREFLDIYVNKSISNKSRIC
jgi:putative PIN family toxin of toxin-antitoxin system